MNLFVAIKMSLNISISVCAFPYIMAFAEDLLEIRLVANGSLVHAACIPGLKLLCGRKVSISASILKTINKVSFLW